MFAPSTPRPAVVIDLNVTPGSSSDGRPSVEMLRKQARAPFTGTMPAPRVLFDGMPTPTPAVDEAKEVALAIMSVDLSKMSDKTRAWFEARQKEMLDAKA